MKNPLHPPPAPPGFSGGAQIPEGSASILSSLFLHWLGPLLGTGFSRPLEQDDLWSLPHSRLTSHLTDELERHFYSILPDDKQAAPSSYQSADHVTRSDETEKTEMRENPNEQVSLLKAIYRQFFWQCWYTGSLTLIAQTLPTLTPLVTKALLTWLTDSYVFFHLSPADKQESLSSEPQGIGYGVGVAIGLFFMQQGASLMNAHSSKFAMSLGLSVRTAIIGCITRKSLRLSARARLEHPSGQIFTMISTDADRADKFCIYGHHLWIAPIQLIITAGLLIATLGYSALVGLGVLILSLPVQAPFCNHDTIVPIDK